MSAMQRNKGKAGEREAAELVRVHTGWDVRRRVRQHDGDDDLVGIPGWAPEVKRHKAAGRADIARWWLQTVEQAGDALPVLFYRLDRDSWRAVWPLAMLLTAQRADYWRAIEWTADTIVQAWAAAVREIHEASREGAAPGPSRPQRSTNLLGSEPHEMLTFVDLCAGSAGPVAQGVGGHSEGSRSGAGGREPPWIRRLDPT